VSDDNEVLQYDLEIVRVEQVLWTDKNVSYLKFYA